MIHSLARSLVTQLEEEASEVRLARCLSWGETSLVTSSEIAWEFSLGAPPTCPSPFPSVHIDQDGCNKPARLA